MKRKPIILADGNVIFSEEEKSQEAYGFKDCEYHWEHLPTGEKGTRCIYLYDKRELPDLISLWNTRSDDWRYSF